MPRRIRNASRAAILKIGNNSAVAMSALVLVSNEGLQTTSSAVTQNPANAKYQCAIWSAYLFIMKMNDSLRAFPLRTLMLCFTIWLIATEVLVFGQLKFDAKAELLNQAARALRGSNLIAPSERQSNLPGDASMEKL